MTKKKSDTELGTFLKNWFPVLVTTLLTCFTSILVTYMTLVANGKTVPIPKNIKGFSIPFEVQFVVIFFLTLFFVYLTLSSARNVLLKYRESKQESPPSMFFVSTNRGDIMSQLAFYDDFKKNDNLFLFETGITFNPNLHVSYVSDPHCSFIEKNSDEPCNTEMKCSKTFLGRYLYKCDRCGYEVKSKNSPYTLQSKVERVILSEVKRRIKSGEIDPNSYNPFPRRR